MEHINRQDTIHAAVDTLMARWDANAVAEETDPGLSGMAEMQIQGLQDQVNGVLDMSADELDADMVALLGWTLPAAHPQMEWWHGVVNIAARKWLRERGY